MGQDMDLIFHLVINLLCKKEKYHRRLFTTYNLMINPLECQKI